jgi:hypothetical protein
MVQPGFFLNYPISWYQILCKKISKISQSSTRKEKFPKNSQVFIQQKKLKQHLQKSKGYKPHGCKLLLSTEKPKLAIFGKRIFFFYT